MINKLENLKINTFPSSVYNLNEYTLQELLCKFSETINKCVNSSNLSLDFLNWLKNEGLRIEVISELEKMYQDGRLTELINSMSNDLTNKILDVENKYNTLNTDLTNYKESNNTLVNKNTEDIKLISKSLSENRLKLISDIDGTDYKMGDIIDIDFIRSEQIKNYSHQMRKLKTGNLTTIICRGDSLTYGYDINSENRITPSNILTDTGRSHIRERASKQYPMMLEQYLKEYGYNVTTLNLGYSGAWVKFSYDEYYKRRADNLEIIMLGTNDSRLENCPYKGDVKQFIEYYEQLIIREILFGNGLILMQPMDTRNNKDMDIETFRIAVKLLSDKYCIPLIDTSAMINNYNYSIWSDDTHLNDKGYSILASKISSAIAMQDLTQPLQVYNGTMLLTRPTLDSIKYVNDKAVFFTATSGYTPHTVDEERIACRLNKDGQVIYSFYNNIEGNVILPTIFLDTNTKVKFELDFTNQQAELPLSTSYYKTSTYDNVIPSVLELENLSSAKTISKYNAQKEFYEIQPLILANKGFYSLRITNISEVEGIVNLFGLEFLSLESWNNIYNKSRYERLAYSDVGVGTVEEMISLSESAKHFDSLFITFNFYGLESRTIDFNQSDTHYIKTINMADDTGADKRVLYNEMKIQLIDDKTIKVLMNKTLISDETGTTTYSSSQINKIKTIYGIKY